MEEFGRRLGLNTNPVVFFTSAVFIVVFVAAAALFPAPIASAFGSAAGWISGSLGWFYILTVTLFVGIVVVLGFSRYGNLRLGPEGSRPQYSGPTWFAMLFTAGIGSVLMFYGVSEPVSNMESNPMGMESQAGQAEVALNFPLYHYGLHAWGVFGLAGLALAYFAYRRGMPLRIRSAFYPLLGERIHGPIGHVIDIFTVLGTVFGVAVTLGLAGSQVNAGVSEVTGIASTELIQAVIIGAITLGAVISVALGLDRGIRRLGQTNMILAIVLLGFVLAAGPTVFLLQSTVQNAGYYFQNLVEFSFWNQAFNDTGWQGDWTVFIWAWQISWAPFVGMFIARISYGRTIREFVLGVLFAPLAFTILWFSVFGGAALDIMMNAGGGGIAEATAESTSLSMFALLDNFPLTLVTSLLAIVVIGIFFVTSADSASLVLDTLTAGDDGESKVIQRIFWASALGAIAIVLLAAGGLDALSNVVTTTGLPFCLVLAVMSLSLIKGLREESHVVKPLTAADQEPAEEEPEVSVGAADRTPEREVQR